MKYERGSFIVVPSREKLRGMPVPAQALYMWMCSYANETGECYPSKETLAKDCDCSRDTIDRMTKLLVERGLIECENRFKGKEQLTNLYTVIIHSGTPLPAPVPPPPPTIGGPLPRISGTELNPILTQYSRAEPRESISYSKESEETERVASTKPKYPHAKEVFGWFPHPEPSWNALKNVREREAAEYLWERGEKTVKMALVYHDRHKDDEGYGYVIVKPSQLESKWNDIAEYARRNK